MFDFIDVVFNLLQHKAEITCPTLLTKFLALMKI